MEGHEEAPEISLEEQIRILQDEGLPPEKVVERILEEDLNADVGILADTLHLDKLVIGRIKGRLSRLKKRREEKAAAATPAEAKGGEEPLYKGELDTTSILKDILKKHPDIPAKVVEEVCSWAEFGPIHPTQLISLLQSFRGLTATTAYIVAQKYALALQKAQLEGKVQMPPLVGGPMPSTQSQWGLPGGFPQGQQQAPQTSYTSPLLGTPPAQATWPYQQYPLTQQDIRSIIREELRGTREPRETEQYADIEEPVRDSEGKVIIGPDDRPIVKRMHMPVSAASQLIAPTKEDVEMRLLEKLAKYKELFGPKEDLTIEKIREIVRDEMPPTGKEEKPITLEDVQKASSEAAQSAVKQVEEAREKENIAERRHKELLSAVERGASAKAVEGYKEDSFRILGQGLSEAASVAREKKPVDIAARILLGSEPSPKEVEAGAGEGLVNRLKKRGWVVEQ